MYSPLPVIVEGSNQNMSRPTAANDDGNTPKTPSYDPPEDTHQTMFTPPTSQETVESESEDMFITPKTPCYEPLFDESICTGSSPLLRRVPSPDNRPSKRARLSRSQTGPQLVDSLRLYNKEIKPPPLCSKKTESLWGARWGVGGCVLLPT